MQHYLITTDRCKVKVGTTFPKDILQFLFQWNLIRWNMLRLGQENATSLGLIAESNKTVTGWEKLMTEGRKDG